MDDLRERLRHWDYDHKTCAGLLDEAANEIERLRSALTEIADRHNNITGGYNAYRIAREALMRVI